MRKNHYMKNRQKLLFMVEELHKRGYEKLRVVPSLSPTGLAWRCEFVVETGELFHASNWLEMQEGEKKEIRQTPQELAEMFLSENYDFLNKCRGINKEYTDWYRAMIKSLTDDELPYAFAEYFSPADFWETSKGHKIKTLPGEKDYYFNY